MLRAEPWLPPWSLDDQESRAEHAANCTAIQLLAQGNCPEHLQRRALNFLIETLCATYDLSFRPQSDRATVFAEGKRWVGLQLVHMLKVDTAALVGRKSAPQG